MKTPCKRQGTNHRHVVAWRTPRGQRDFLADRCRSLLLWSTAAFHLLAGDEDVTVDGEPLRDVRWAETYLAAMEADPMAWTAAKRVRAALAAREAQRAEA